MFLLISFKPPQALTGDMHVHAWMRRGLTKQISQPNLYNCTRAVLIESFPLPPLHFTWVDHGKDPLLHVLGQACDLPLPPGLRTGWRNVRQAVGRPQGMQSRCRCGPATSRCPRGRSCCWHLCKAPRKPCWPSLGILPLHLWVLLLLLLCFLKLLLSSSRLLGSSLRCSRSCLSWGRGSWTRRAPADLWRRCAQLCRPVACSRRFRLGQGTLGA